MPRPEKPPLPPKARRLKGATKEFDVSEEEAAKRAPRIAPETKRPKKAKQPHEDVELIPDEDVVELKEGAGGETEIVHEAGEAEAQGHAIEMEAEPRTEEERQAAEAHKKELRSSIKKAGSFELGAWVKEKEKKEKETQARIAGMGERVDKAMAQEDAFEAGEGAWFKKGEDERRQMAEARAQIEAAGGKPESLVETPAEVEASARQAEAMIKSGEINPKFFDAQDYRYLLLRKAQLDRDLENASWTRVRALRSELKEVQDGLRDYEQQIQSVMRERAEARDQMNKPAAEAAPAPKRLAALPGGSGTSVHTAKKKGFFARLFGR